MKLRHSARSTKGSASGPWGADLPASSRVGVNENSNALKAFGGGADLRRRPDVTGGFDAGASRSATAWARRLHAAARSLWASWRRELECARSIRELEQLDDRSLRDIGIAHRSEIDHLVRFGRRRR